MRAEDLPRSWHSAEHAVCLDTTTRYQGPPSRRTHSPQDLCYELISDTMVHVAALFWPGQKNTAVWAQSAGRAQDTVPSTLPASKDVLGNFSWHSLWADAFTVGGSSAHRRLAWASNRPHKPRLPATAAVEARKGSKRAKGQHRTQPWMALFFRSKALGPALRASRRELRPFSCASMLGVVQPARHPPVASTGARSCRSAQSHRPRWNHSRQKS